MKGSNILVLGSTFKENCPDIHNSKVVDVIRSLKEYEAHITIHDPWANPEEVKHEYGLEILMEMSEGIFDAVVVAVKHREFEKPELSSLIKSNKIVYRVK